MGLIIEKFCCLDSKEILENSKFQKLTIDDYSNQIEKRDSETQLPISYIKSLPEPELRIITPEKTKIKIKSISTLPISSKDLIRMLKGNPFDDYKLIKKLGNGTYGKVYKVKSIKTGNIRAMKIIPNDNLRPGFTEKDINREINIMKNLDHPHIIKLYEFYHDENNYYLINEYCTEGDLSEKLYQLKYLPEPIVKILMAQIFNAVFYLNSKGIIHGDLKLGNILVDSYLDNGTIKSKEKGNFISSLIEDTRNVQNYIKNRKVRRSLTTQEKNYIISRINHEKNKFKSKNLNISKKYDSINIIQEEAKEDEFNNEERKDNYILKDNNEETNILGFENNDDDEEDSNQNNFNNLDKKHIFSINETKNKSSALRKDNVVIEKNKTFTINNYFNNNNEKNEAKIMKKSFQRKKTYNYNSMNIKNFELKLIDFGCSKIFSPQKNITFEDTIGTLFYCSPEVLKNNYDQKCDIWACGVIMYLLLCGKHPFAGKDEEEITRNILFGKLNFNHKHFINVSESAKDLIRKCLIRDKNKRISIKEILNHEFFAGEININNIFEDEVVTQNVLSKLKKYGVQLTKLYQVVLSYLSYNFADKEHLQKLRNIFYKIDLNMDGKLSREELYFAYKEAGIEIDKEELNKIMKSIDFDGNGFIEYEEFIRVTLPKELLFTDSNLKNAFDMFDKDKNGTISMEEIIEVLGVDKEFDKNAIEELKKEISYDPNTEIDFHHFKNFMLGLKDKNN